MGPSHFWCHDQDWSATLGSSGLLKFQNSQIPKIYMVNVRMEKLALSITVQLHLETVLWTEIPEEDNNCVS